MRLSRELNEFRRSVAIANSGYHGEQRVHMFSRKYTRYSVFHMRRSCICICIIDACKVIHARCTCVYIFTYVCKCTWYNMHYRSRATPRQFSTSLRFEVLKLPRRYNRRCNCYCAPAGASYHLLGTLNYYLSLNHELSIEWSNGENFSIFIDWLLRDARH